MVPPVQVEPHAPQLSGSPASETHERLQFVSPVAHVLPQAPPLQTWLGPQALLQPPQFQGSVRVFAQAFEHRVRLALAQTHVPASQSDAALGQSAFARHSTHRFAARSQRGAGAPHETVQSPVGRSEPAPPAAPEAAPALPAAVPEPTAGVLPASRVQTHSLSVMSNWHLWTPAAPSHMQRNTRPSTVPGGHGALDPRVT
jgi:hypothetical protein